MAREPLPSEPAPLVKSVPSVLNLRFENAISVSEVLKMREISSLMYLSLLSFRVTPLQPHSEPSFYRIYYTNSKPHKTMLNAYNWTTIERLTSIVKPARKTLPYETN